jgi:hypothetical protein
MSMFEQEKTEKKARAKGQRRETTWNKCQANIS